jgi:hypothetical protein
MATPADVTRPNITVPGVTTGTSSTSTTDTTEDGILWNPGGPGPSAVTGKKSYKSKRHNIKGVYF